MLKVGITGGIGSGKTHICQLFQQLGVPVYNADERAKNLMNNDPIVKQGLVDTFGPEVFNKDGLNRDFLAQVVFKDKVKLKQLNDIVHPAVAQDTQAWHLQHNDKPYTIKEAALLFETGSFKELDKTILVHAKEDERILRVMRRDKVSKEKVLARIKNQFTDLVKMEHADFIINNDGNREIEKMVEKIHSYFNMAAIS
ncbi:MAG: dephospho-CoA kinase [Chitinophagales bacterium]|nr:dephospho-CoA kinase [Chitinophagales bacterium]